MLISYIGLGRCQWIKIPSYSGAFCDCNDITYNSLAVQELSARLVQYIRQRLRYVENFWSGCTYVCQFMAIWKPGNNQGNFQLHRSTTSDNIEKIFLGGLLFW